jgi:hypothetical protein
LFRKILQDFSFFPAFANNRDRGQVDKSIDIEASLDTYDVLRRRDGYRGRLEEMIVLIAIEQEPEIRSVDYSLIFHPVVDAIEANSRTNKALLKLSQMNNLALLLHNIKCIYFNLLSRCCSLVVNKIVGIWTGSVVVMLRWVWKPKRLSPILLELLMRNNGESGHEYKPDKHNGLQIYSKEISIFVAKIWK